MQTGNSSCIYNNDLDKACFQHDTTYGKYKNLTKRTQSDKVLRDKAFKHKQLANELHKPIIRKFEKKKSLFFI